MMSCVLIVRTLAIHIHPLSPMRAAHPALTKYTFIDMFVNGYAGGQYNPRHGLIHPRSNTFQTAFIASGTCTISAPYLHLLHQATQQRPKIQW